MNAPLLRVDGVTFAYPQHAASVVEVTFEMQPGERVAILGANGSGKSTLLHLLNGLCFAQTGTIQYSGHLVTEKTIEQPPLGGAFRREVGFLFQNSDAQLFCSTVEEELAFGPLQMGLAREEMAQRIADTLALLDIEHLRHRVPQRLSAGEKKTVALASLLTIGPRLLLLDEPTAGLDPRSQSVLVDILGQLNDKGVGLFTATHDLLLCEHVADRALVLSEEHRLVADGPLQGILGDLPLLQRVNLVHQHSHRHGNVLHQHPHIHAPMHGHRHPH
jgi:cobalt/nickel transport system ATP-binding protein